MKKVKLQAHRGVSSEYPENTMAAFYAAIEEGYDIIECDPKYTKDGEIVILHDRTLNKTARRISDGSALEEPKSIYETTLAQTKEFEYGSWKDEKFKGEGMPLLSDLLDFAENTKIPIKIDNVWEKFIPEMQDKLFAAVAERGDRINVGFTCALPENLERVAVALPNADLHYDGKDLSDEALSRVAEIAKGHHLYIWVCFDNDITKWFKGEKATQKLCERVRRYGELGIWILSKREELTPAIIEYGAQVIETTGHIKPEWLSDFEA